MKVYSFANAIGAAINVIGFAETIVAVLKVSDSFKSLKSYLKHRPKRSIEFNLSFLEIVCNLRKVKKIIENE